MLENDSHRNVHKRYFILLSMTFDSFGDDYLEGLYDEIQFDPYLYIATVVNTYDGDTTTLNIDLGFDITSKQRVRLYGIDAPEVRGTERKEGIKSREYLRQIIPDNSAVYVRTIRDKKGKYGRYLAILYVKHGERFLNVNKFMVKTDHAKAYRL